MCPGHDEGLETKEVSYGHPKPGRTQEEGRRRGDGEEVGVNEEVSPSRDARTSRKP